MGRVPGTKAVFIYDIVIAQLQLADGYDLLAFFDAAQ